MAHGFFVASRNTVRMRLPSLPTRTHAWRCASAAPRSVTSEDHGPGPKRAVSAPAAELCRPAMAATSLSVASRNLNATASLPHPHLYPRRPRRRMPHPVPLGLEVPHPRPEDVGHPGL